MSNKKMGILILMLALIVTFMGGTLAYFNWQITASQRTNVTFTVASGFTCGADGGGDITSSDVMLAPSTCDDANYAIQREVKINTDINNGNIIEMNMWLKVNDIGPNLAESENFKYALTDSNLGCTNEMINDGYNDHVIASGSFSGANPESNSEFLILGSKQYSETVTDETYYLYIWLDEAETDTSIMGESFSITLDGTCGMLKTMSCDPGEYLPEGSETCVECPDGASCPGWSGVDDGEEHGLIENYTISFSSTNNNCPLDNVTYAAVTATYNVPIHIEIPTCDNYIFDGWSAVSGLDTSNAKYGMSSRNLNNSWSNANDIVSVTWFNNLAQKPGKAISLAANWVSSYYKTYDSDNNVIGTYTNISAAYDSINTSSGKIELLASLTDNTSMTVASDKSIILDVGAHEVVFSGVGIVNNGTLNIIGTGDIINNSNSDNCTAVANNGTLNLTGPSIGSSECTAVLNTGSFNMSSGLVTSLNKDSYKHVSGTGVISGGTIDGGDNELAILQSNGILDLTGGEIVSNAITSALISVDGGTLNIDGALLSKTVSNTNLILANAGVINLISSDINWNYASSCVFINGGTFNVNGGSITTTNTGRAIYLNTGNFSVQSGTVTSERSETISAKEGTATLSGGTVSNKSGNQMILVSNSTLNVTGGSFAGSGNGNAIKITGGLLNVTGGSITWNKTASFITQTGGTINQSAGTLVSTNSGRILYQTGGAFIKTGGVIDGGNSAEAVMQDGANSIFNMSNGTIANSSNTLRAFHVKNGQFNLSGGTISATNAETILLKKGTVNISSGNVSNSSNASVVGVTGGTLNLTGGSFAGSNDGSGIKTTGGILNITSGIYNWNTNSSFIYINDGNVNISGGTINSLQGKAVYQEGGTLNLTGGVLQARSNVVYVAAGDIIMGVDDDVYNGNAPTIISSTDADSLAFMLKNGVWKYYDGSIYSKIKELLSSGTAAEYMTDHYPMIADDSTYIQNGVKLYLGLDTIPPTGYLEADFSNGTVNATVSASDDESGLKSEYGYYISKNNICNDTLAFTITDSSSYNFQVSEMAKYYVCVRISDNKNNYAYLQKSANVKAFLKNLSAPDVAFKESQYKQKISTIKVVDYVDTTNAVATYNLSDNNDNKIVGWLAVDANNASLYNLYIGSNFEIHATNFMNAFSEMTNVSNVDLGEINSAEVKSMTNMFLNTGANANTFNINLGNSFNTGNVTTMLGTFSGMGRNAANFNINLGSDFDTSNVTTMQSMFANMGSSATNFNLDLGKHFDTSKVGYMGEMFLNVGSSSNQFSLNLGNKFNTAKVTSIYSMFANAGMSSNDFRLELGDLFNICNVTSAPSMFARAGKSANSFILDLGHDFNTANLTKAQHMFKSTGENAHSYSLDLGDKFNTSKVTDMSYMFDNAGRNAANFDLDLGGNFNTYMVNTFQQTFTNAGRNASNFNINLGNKINTSNASVLSLMFFYMGNNTTKPYVIDLSAGNFTNATSFGGLLSGFPVNYGTIYVKDETAKQFLTSNSNAWGVNFTASSILIK